MTTTTIYIYKLTGTPNPVMFASEVPTMDEDYLRATLVFLFKQTRPQEWPFIFAWFCDYKRHEADLQITPITLIT